jgi:adenine/guanine phosphoribosyltransferase-like PRPP-binding protein
MTPDEAAKKSGISTANWLAARTEVPLVRARAQSWAARPSERAEESGGPRRGRNEEREFHSAFFAREKAFDSAIHRNDLALPSFVM